MTARKIKYGDSTIIHHMDEPGKVSIFSSNYYTVDGEPFSNISRACAYINRGKTRLVRTARPVIHRA